MTMPEVRLIDANTEVRLQVYDEERDEYYMLTKTVAELLNEWTEEGCPPTIDAVEVVRCRECEESEHLAVLDTDCLYCGVWDTTVHCNGYCYHGEKMDAQDMDVPTKDGGED